MRQSNDPDVLSQALAEPSRRALLENLRFGQKTVTELVKATALKQPNVSNHLAKMRQQGIVRAERIGRQVYYSLSTPFADVLLRMHEIAASSSMPVRAAVPFHSDTQATTESASLPSVSDGEAPMQHQSRSDVHGMPEGKVRAVNLTHLLKQAQDAYFTAVMAGDEEKAVTLINSLVAQRLPMETIYLEVFAKSINHIGELYRQGATSEAHEHMASAITERIMARISQFYMPVARLSYRAILGCVAGNWHVLGLRMLADGLKTLGWDTIFLGANVPTSSLVAMTEGVKPDLVVISCAMQEQAASAHELLHELDALRHKNASHKFQIAVGGHYFQEQTDELFQLPVDLTASDMNQFLHVVQSHFPEDRPHVARS